DWSRLGAPVFVRGQLRSYSKLLGLTIEPVVEAAGVEPVRPPTLTPRTYVAPWQRFAEQAARRFVARVVTVAIAIPVRLAPRPHLDIVAHEGAPLDAPATDATRSPAPAEPATDPHPLVASLAPIPARAPALSLRFSGESWVEVMDAEGKVLEQALLHAGDRRKYEPGEVGSVVLGNASAVEVRQQGRKADIAPF